MRELPRDISGFELRAFFMFSPAGRALIEARQGDAHAIGQALQIGFLRMSDRLLDTFRIVPPGLWHRAHAVDHGLRTSKQGRHSGCGSDCIVGPPAHSSGRRQHLSGVVRAE